MNMAAANPHGGSKSSESAFVKENRLLDMEAKVRALLFELQPPENLQKLESEEGREEHQEQKTAPLILDNSLPEDDKAQRSEFNAPGKTSKFESLLSGISKAMVALESVRQGSGIAPRPINLPGGVDFSQDDGRLCVVKEEQVDSLERDQVLSCSHRSEEKCHNTQITVFSPTQEERCDEIFEKKCQIVFRKEAQKDLVHSCLRPLLKECTGQGERTCTKESETACTTVYRRDGNSDAFLGDTKCKGIPVEVCGAGCVTRLGEEECHVKEIDSLVDVPEEFCDLNPQKTCKLVTKLVPRLKARRECTQVPREFCTLELGPPQIISKPLRTEWCLESSTSLKSSTSMASTPPPPIDLSQYSGQLPQSLRRLRRQFIQNH